MCAVKAEGVSRRGALTEGAHFYDTLDRLETASSNEPLRSPGRRGLATFRSNTCGVPATPAIAVQAIRQAHRRAQACDVQEQHTSGVQPEQVEHELTRAPVTATVVQGISVNAGSLCGALQYMPPAKKGSKGMNWQGGIPSVRPPDEYVEEVNLVSQ